MVEKLDWFESLWVWPMVWAVTPPSQPFSLLSTPSQPYPLPKSLLYNLLILPTAPCHNPTFDLKVRWAQFFIHSNEMTKLLACCRLGHVKEPVAVGEWCLVKLCGNSTNELLFSFHLFFFFFSAPPKKTKQKTTTTRYQKHSMPAWLGKTVWTFQWYFLLLNLLHQKGTFTCQLCIHFHSKRLQACWKKIF